MRFPKEFKNNGGNGYILTTSEKYVEVLQWNTGKNKHFAVELLTKNYKKYVKIEGKGDEALQKAIQVAYELAK